jgi:hypothetical protein
VTGVAIMGLGNALASHASALSDPPNRVHVGHKAVINDFLEAIPPSRATKLWRHNVLST